MQNDAVAKVDRIAGKIAGIKRVNNDALERRNSALDGNA